jgi:hypothetical protein
MRVSDAQESMLSGLFAAIDARDTTAFLQHLSERELTYARHDGSTITLPFVDVFNLDADRIANYKIFMDIGPLYA